LWDGFSAPGPDNGICVPGTYTERTVPNIGEACNADLPVGMNPDCWSPFGLGVCLGGAGSVWAPSNYCSILGCEAPGAPADICGAGNACVVLFDGGDGMMGADLGACFKECASATECAPGHACLPEMALVMTGRPQGVCFPICTEDGQCRTGETCMGAGTPEGGTCEAM
jgi:hypothetical protein